ncbi:hypothetical protein [Streptomyces sp. LaPpAH-108]|uniref:hypothetical protein n=1 Tax=Streptomyces sp. LaPpAH-108 TaxID=1155714 RepID=UPI000378859C|nr:hypothetical protein [Streptomyces sp. LaPpAH-108]
MTDQQTLPTPEEQAERQPLLPVGAATRRPRLRAALRWAAAVAVFAVAGTGTAYGITLMDRTDVPGLATRSDGRWDYPELVRPPLPAGSPGPLAAANKAGAHYADLRALVLPAPHGATLDPALKGDDGWVTMKDFLAPYAASGRPDVRQMLVDNGLRHIAARGWTTPDGTRTRIYLLQFDTAAVAEDVLGKQFTGYAEPRYPVAAAGTYQLEEPYPAARVKGVSVVDFNEARPYGKEQLRMAYLGAGDTVAMITQTRAGGVGTVPFWQTLTLQSELLG